MWMLPNLLTLARIAAVAPLVALIHLELWVAALALFLVAAATDWLDGFLARRWNQQSDLGRMLDPIADKLIVSAALVAMIGHALGDALSTVAVIAIITRELAVAGLREFLGPRNIAVPVSPLAKWKTASQLASIGLLLAGMVFARSGLSELSFACATLGWSALLLSALLAWITAIAYLRAGLRHMEPPR